jgi:phosphohistidine phosphatase
VKTLFLLRHAKSGWNEPGESDHARTLTPRGRRAAELVSVYLARRRDPPGLLLCSTARRALETMEPLRHRLGVPLEIDGALYLAEAETILARVAEVEDSTSGVLVVGHNPGLHELALLLAARGDGEARARLRESFPTAALAIFEIEIEQWGQLRPRCGTLVELRVPKDLV